MTPTPFPPPPSAPPAPPPDPERARGTLWGLLVGNALGAPLDGLKEGHIRQCFGTVRDFVDLHAGLPEKPWRWRRPGLHAGAGQQALLLVEALASTGGDASSTAPNTDAPPRSPVPDSFVTRLARLYLSLVSPPGGAKGRPASPDGAHRGLDDDFRAVLASLGRRVLMPGDPTLWRYGRPSAGCAAAARIAPLGVWPGVETEEDLVRLAIEVSLTTHSTPQALSAAVAVAVGVRRFAVEENDGRRLDARHWVQNLTETVRAAEERLLEDYAPWLDADRDRARDRDLSAALGVLASLTEEDNDDLACRTLVAQARDCAAPRPLTHPNADWFAPAAVPMAFYRALTAPNYARGLEVTVNAGASTAVLGAMVGALLGARYGPESIPSEWREGMVARRLVAQRAEGLALGYRVRPWDDLLAAEAEWTRDEEAARQAQIEALERARERQGRTETARSGRAATKSKAKGKPTGGPPAGGATGKPGAGERADLPFAPPPEIWLRGKTMSKPALDSSNPCVGYQSPEEKKKEKAARGRKRIAWKETRRGKKHDDDDNE